MKKQPQKSRNQNSENRHFYIKNLTYTPDFYNI